ncbi:hypothetical protein RvY_16186-1 [Ramazzottius varieornatus]|uniref:Uncharacterized protein n=1 Tax=Ramazzottius varieornatus TaxID=947166 RepID=A0A1D1VXK1_RAMVA|nr:hypothetical protein RvY_16186-1 [Ramazzottius varieornatus]
MTRDATLDWKFDLPHGIISPFSAASRSTFSVPSLFSRLNLVHALPGFEESEERLTGSHAVRFRRRDRRIKQRMVSYASVGHLPDLRFWCCPLFQNPSSIFHWRRFKLQESVEK